jgi:cellulose synthase/poly-beta-1,6-N-acetylglucosamine synthase-like glycosyltransferase
MVVWLVLTAILLGMYCMLIVTYRYWIRQLQPFAAIELLPVATRFSIVIPARNEAENIEACVLSVLQQNYPTHLFEVIVVDDYSTDATAAIVQKLAQKHLNLSVISMQTLEPQTTNSYKKKAIETAIAHANGDWIICTDADCTIPQTWLRSYDAVVQEQQPVFIAGPVFFTHNGTFLSAFQALDFLSLQGITAAAVSAGFHSMCNGANLAYSKTAFYQVDGFKNIDHIASGDDMLLMHKLKQQFPQKIAYLYSQSATVFTKPMLTWKAFINQRIRWASKTVYYQDKNVFWVLMLVLAVNTGLLGSILLAAFWWTWLPYVLLLVLIKTIVELSFMQQIARFANSTALLIWFPIMQPFHITYTVLAAFWGMAGKYEWKGRTVK